MQPTEGIREGKGNGEEAEGRAEAVTRYWFESCVTGTF